MVRGATAPARPRSPARRGDARQLRAAAVATAVAALAGLAAGCGSPPPARSRVATPAAPPTPRRAPGARRGGAVVAPTRRGAGVRLRVVATRSLPAPVQLPGLARVGRTVLAAGGLDAADASVADVVRVAPGRPRRVGTLPAAIHDVGVAALGSRLYVFGGGTPGGPTDAVTQARPRGPAPRARPPPPAMFCTPAATPRAPAQT